MVVLPRVLSSQDLPATELQAARLDGELFGIGEAFCPIDEFEDPAHRAAAVLGTRSRRLVAELGTAAWIWGATVRPPSMLEFCARLAARARAGPSRHLTVREVVLDPADITVLGEVRVTSPLRTAVDLARFRDDFGGAETAIVTRLARLGGFELEEAIGTLERRAHLHGKTRAVSRLRAALSPN